MNPDQSCYPVSDMEALCIQEILYKHRDIMPVLDITIETNHKNIIQRDLKYPFFMYWCLLIDKFSPKMVYLPGKYNLDSDQLSHLPLLAYQRRHERSTHEVMREFFIFHRYEIDAFPLGFDEIYTDQHVDTMPTNLL